MKPQLPRPGALRKTFRILGTPQSPEERALLDAIAEATSELLSDAEFDVRARGQFIEIVGTGSLAGNTTIMMQALMWRAPMEADARLRLMFESYVTRLQEFVSRATGADWPASDAKGRVTISQQTILAWWEDSAGVTLRAMPPIALDTIGISSNKGTQ
jgi:hypothetical protein